MLHTQVWKAQVETQSVKLEKTPDIREKLYRMFYQLISTSMHSLLVYMTRLLPGPQLKKKAAPVHVRVDSNNNTAPESWHTCFKACVSR